MTLSCTYDGGAVTHKFAPSGLNVTHRADGEASFGGIPFEDPTASLAIVGHRLFTVEDGECAQPRIFTGFTTERGIGRSLDEGMFVGAAPRLVDVTLVDMNAALGFRQITGADGNRPAETWAARLTWILGSDYLSEFISSDETWIVTNTTAIEAADYRGAYATAVLDDLVDRSGGAYVYFAFYDTVAAEVRLFFDNDSESIGDCTLAISNVVADIDSSVTFAPDLVAKLAREPDQTYSDVTVTYDRGAKKLYRYRASTAATYVRRGTEISRPYTKGLATATAQAEKWLDKHAVETDRITCTIRVPAASAGLVQAGQSIQARFSHLGATYSVAGGATMRIVSCSPKPTDDTGYWYDIALELVGARPVVEEGCDCLEGEDGTITTGVTDVSVRQVTVGPIHVPANCSMTITRYDWTEWTPGIALPVRIGGTFKDVLDNSLDEHMFTDFGSNPYGVKVTLGADLGSPHGAGFSTDDLGIPDVGWALSGMLIENGSANDFDIWWHGDSNPYFESTGTWSVTATYTCGDGAPADEIIDLGPTPGATTTHTTDPTVDDDETLGYGTPGMHWVNTTTGHEFVLIDGTDGAAVWVSTTAVSVFSFSTSDGVTTVDPTTELTFVGGTLADLGGGVAELTFTGSNAVTNIDGGKEVVSTVAAAGATETLDLADGNVHDVTLSADCTLTFAGATAGVACSFTLLLRQDGTGGWTTTWPGSVVWAGGSAPTLDETASTVAVLTFFTLDGGTVWYGFPTGGGGVAGGTPALTFGTTNAQGSAATAVLTDATLAIFDATVPTTAAAGDAAATGSAAFGARRDHRHGMPAFAGELLVADSPLPVPRGTFSTTANQTVASTTTAYAVALATDDIKVGLTHSTVTNNSRIYIDQAGTYSIIVSAIADDTAADKTHLALWLAVDGANVANSNTVVEIATKETEVVVSVAFAYDFTAGQYFELMYRGDATTTRFIQTAAGSSPTRPASPAVIVAVNMEAPAVGLLTNGPMPLLTEAQDDYLYAG